MIEMTFGGKPTKFWMNLATTYKNSWLTNAMEDLAVMAADLKAKSDHYIADREGGKVIVYTERITVYYVSGNLYHKTADYTKVLTQLLDLHGVEYTYENGEDGKCIIIQNRYW